jgi:transcriptional regulator with XRE-family HTH domain
MPRRPRSSDHKMATEVDIHVGERLRQRRMLRGLSLTQLAKSLRVSYQQLQKYETGGNRISASRLYELAQLLDIPIVWFFEGIENPYRNNEVDGLLQDEEILQFVGAYYRITDTEARRRLHRLASVLAGAKNETISQRDI